MAFQSEEEVVVSDDANHELVEDGFDVQDGLQEEEGTVVVGTDTPDVVVEEVEDKQIHCKKNEEEDTSAVQVKHTRMEWMEEALEVVVEGEGCPDSLPEV